MAKGWTGVRRAYPDVAVPKETRAITYHVEERYGLIWVCMGTPANDIPP